MNNLFGKKLLILGATASENEIIAAARQMGLYAIVTDNHTDWSFAPAKYLADEAWNISWTDTDQLVEACQKAHVEGCMAGFSENRVKAALKLSHALGVPFYADGADLDTISDKGKFKAACAAAGIRVPKQYWENEEVVFPVIVKPADNGGSRGITICYNSEELQEGVSKARACSPAASVIIEEYLSYDEIMVYFTVHDGEATLSLMCDRYMHRFDRNITQLPVGYYYPSRHLTHFRIHALAEYKRLIRSLGIRNGLIAFQAFAAGDNVIPFDPTYRLDGTMAYHISEYRNGTNVLQRMITMSLTGSMGDGAEILRLEKPALERPAFELPILLGKGMIRSIRGLDKISQLPEVIYVNQRHTVGEFMEKKADFSQILCRIHICADSDSAILAVVKQIFDWIQVEDEAGQDMVLGRNIDYSELMA